MRDRLRVTTERASTGVIVVSNTLADLTVKKVLCLCNSLFDLVITYNVVLVRAISIFSEVLKVPSVGESIERNRVERCRNSVEVVVLIASFTVCFFNNGRPSVKIVIGETACLTLLVYRVITLKCEVLKVLGVICTLLLVVHGLVDEYNDRLVERRKVKVAGDVVELIVDQGCVNDSLVPARKRELEVREYFLICEVRNVVTNCLASACVSVVSNDIIVVEIVLNVFHDSG